MRPRILRHPCSRKPIFVASSPISSLSKFAMKTLVKYLLFACFLSFNLPTSIAQMNDGVRFGLVAGLNGSSFYDDARADDKKNRIGYSAGVFGQIPLGKGRFSIRPELLLSTKGATFDFQGGTRPEIKLSYAELPVSLQWHLFGILNVHAGMYASLLADSEGKFKEVNGNPVIFEFDKSNFSNVDYGYQIGGGLDLGNIGLHLRVTRGLKEIANEGAIQGYLGGLKNATWALTFGWAFK